MTQPRKTATILLLLQSILVRSQSVFLHILLWWKAQSAENRLTIPRFDNRFHDTEEPLIGHANRFHDTEEPLRGHDREDQGYKMQWRSLGGTTTCVSAQIPTLRLGAKRPQVSDISQWKNAWVNSFWQDQIVHTHYCGCDPLKKTGRYSFSITNYHEVKDNLKKTKKHTGVHQIVHTHYCGWST